MSAGNTFAIAQNGASLSGHGPEDLHDEARPSEKQRTSETLPPLVWLPSAQSETSLEVDIMILDFLAFRATTACLESRNSHSTVSNAAPRGSLQLVNSFVPIFKARNQDYQPDAELRLRLLLLKMTTLFTQRYTWNPTTPDRFRLQALRKDNQQRAEAWLSLCPERRLSVNCQTRHTMDIYTVSPDVLERNRAHVLHQLGIPAEDEDYEDAFYGTAACVSLLDLLPLFVEISAASSTLHDSDLTRRWMVLACEFMLQAFLEQYLVCGAAGLNVLNEAFAWGYAEDAQDHGAATAKHTSEINDMFEDETYAQEAAGWQAFKTEYVQQLFGSYPIDDKDTEPTIIGHLESVAARHPIGDFEASILKFLEALSVSISEPVLVQLEKGQLNGMSKEETTDFLTQCGVSLSLS